MTDEREVYTFDELVCLPEVLYPLAVKHNP